MFHISHIVRHKLENISAFLCLVSLIAFLPACAKNELEPEYVERSVEEIYLAAYDLLEKKQYLEAALEFDEVERQHPYSVWARRALVMSAYAYYMKNKYDDAVLTARRFLVLYPGNQQAAYAYYLIAQSMYEQISDILRDQRNTELAQGAFSEIIRRFPESDYARDARLKLDLIKDHLAGKELAVGMYYLNKGSYLPAIKRFRNVVTVYQQTNHTQEALHRLTEAYLALGLHKEAQVAAAILGHNYPSGEWYQYSYELLVNNNLSPERHKESWLAKAFPALF